MSRATGRHRTATRIRLTDRRRRVGIGITAAAALAAALLSAPAFAGTTVSPSEAGSPPVVRQNGVTVTAATGAQFYYRTANTITNANNTAFTDQTQGGFLLTKAFGRACVGNNTAVGGKNNSPRDTITVTDPNNVVVASKVSPVRNVNAGGAPAANPQPAPNDSNYLGDFPGTGGTHGFSFPVDLTGKPAGIYTVTTVTENKVKTDTSAVQGTCQTGYPSPTNNKVAVLGAQTSTTTFEYRPWQNTFTDVFAGGKVFANVVPSEFQFTVGGQTSAIYGAGYQRFFSLPDATTFMLPSDPATCAADPSTCLPVAAHPCDPAAGCTPRLMTIAKNQGVDKLLGIFDLKTNAFVAGANINGTERVLMSLGTENDALYHDLLVKLAAAAAAQGIDLWSLLATKIRLATGDNELTLSLLNGLQIAPSDAKGLQIISDTTVQAGVILDIYANLGSTTCATNSTSSANAPLKYTPTAGSGYTVTRTALPSVPAVGPLAAIASGPVYHITGKFTGGSSTASAVIGVDTAADQPNGYPVWLSPFTGIHAASPKTMDFLGTASWTASETSLGSLGCFTVDFMLGTGVAIYNNSLPVGFGTLLSPAFDATPASDQLNAQIDSAVQTVVTTVSANPVVSGVLNTLLASLPLPV